MIDFLKETEDKKTNNSSELEFYGTTALDKYYSDREISMSVNIFRRSYLTEVVRNQ